MAETAVIEWMSEHERNGVMFRKPAERFRGLVFGKALFLAAFFPTTGFTPRNSRPECRPIF